MSFVRRPWPGAGRYRHVGRRHPASGRRTGPRCGSRPAGPSGPAPVELPGGAGEPRRCPV